MPKIEISQPHKVTAEEAKKRIELLNKDLGEKYDLKSKWPSETEAHVERTGASGKIKIEPNRIHILLDLSFAMTPFKGKIEERIKGELAKLFKE